MGGTTLHINLNALDESFIEELRQRFGAAEVEIHVLQTPEDWLTEVDFWALIAKLDWSKQGNDEIVIEPVGKVTGTIVFIQLGCQLHSLRGAYTQN